ncbi:single-stranded-DNA-specific exonuclease RecJ [Flavobacteriaceae bacterium UJ101]|nr:single-stranded-DNA-specific exonuclease RecJ [Flavobacteriaceae bacterium UJ101]
MEISQKNRWVLKPEVESTVIKHLMNELKVDAKMAELLALKGIHTFDAAHNFFRPSLERLHDPFLMKDMSIAVSRILKAINEKEHIMIYGDYDVDGTTSVSMMYMFISSLSKNVTHYIPDRYAEGYGVSFQGIQYAIDNDISLIISLDCGIKAVDKVKMAQDSLIDFIICDHHLPGEIMPEAKAILDPKQKDCEYPYKELSGCGVGFKLIQAICKELSLPNNVYEQYLDLVAVSIAADIVPITDENRILAYYGLKKLKEDPNIGLEALLLNFDKPDFTISDVVFKIAPKINAAGRIEHADLAVHLLTSKNYDEVEKIARQIRGLNTERKTLDADVTQEALVQIVENNEENNAASVVFGKNWHKGVLGIVASRLTESYYRPTLVFTESNGKMVASARSVKGYNVYDALDHCSEYLEQFGGHKYAAGLTMASEQYPLFKKAFEEEVKKTIPKSLLIPQIEIDTELKLVDVTPKFNRILKQFAPFGPQNMRPVFLTKNVFDSGYAKAIGNENKHLKMNLYQEGARNIFQAIGFGLGSYLPQIKNKPFDIVYTVEENYWQGKSHIQLNIKDIRIN